MALKLAFKNRPGARNVIVMQDSYHGRSLVTMAASWPHPNNPFHALQPQCFTRVPHPDSYRPRQGMDIEADTKLCLSLLEETITKGVDGGVAALIIEPILGNGGHIIVGKSYLQGLREICTRHNIVLIFDEIQSCFGRTGEMFAADYYGVQPDIMTFGKGIGGGFPLAGIMASDRLEGFSSGEDALTFGQFPVAMAAAVATLDAIISDDLCGKARALGNYATQRLQEMSERHPLIGDVRGPGLFVSVELVKDRKTKEAAPKAAAELYRRGVKKGVLFGESRYAGLGNLIKIKPPLDCSHAQMSHALDVFDAVLGSIEADGIA
jgi:4-aminobutyrate aminotransferase-like enzyme